MTDYFEEESFEEQLAVLKSDMIDAFKAVGIK